MLLFESVKINLKNSPSEPLPSRDLARNIHSTSQQGYLGCQSGAEVAQAAASQP
jgi:hypothetical protein